VAAEHRAHHAVILHEVCCPSDIHVNDRKDDQEPHDEMVNQADLLDREIGEYPASHYFPEEPDVALRHKGKTGQYGNKVAQKQDYVCYPRKYRVAQD
jgi:hypothetical protein